MADEFMHDIKLTDTGDLDTSTGDIQIVSGVDGVVQDIKTRLKSFQGEFFLDSEFGLPYFQEILTKNPDSNLIRSIYREAILSTPFVKSVGNLDLQYDGASRIITVKFDAVIGDTSTTVNVSLGV